MHVLRHVDEWRYRSTILNLGSRWRLMIGFTLLSSFARVQSHQYSLSSSLVGAKGVFGRFGVEKTPLSLPGIRCW